MSWHHVFSAGPLIPELTAIFDLDHVCSSDCPYLVQVASEVSQVLKTVQHQGLEEHHSPWTKSSLDSVHSWRLQSICWSPSEQSLCRARPHPLEASQPGTLGTRLHGRQGLGRFRQAWRGDVKEHRAASCILDGRRLAMAGPGPWAGSGLDHLLRTESPWPTLRRSWAS